MSLTSALVTSCATVLGFLASVIWACNQGTISRTLYAILSPAEGDKEEKEEKEGVVEVHLLI